MKLPVFSRLNIPTKRFGVEVGDWFYILAASSIGMVTQSVLYGVFSMLIVWVYFSQVKPRRPRGWLSAEIEFLLSIRRRTGGHEHNAFNVRRH
jgi:hypothetical protein